MKREVIVRREHGSSASDLAWGLQRTSATHARRRGAHPWDHPGLAFDRAFFADPVTPACTLSSRLASGHPEPWASRGPISPSASGLWSPISWSSRTVPTKVDGFCPAVGARQTATVDRRFARRPDRTTIRPVRPLTTDETDAREVDAERRQERRSRSERKAETERTRDRWLEQSRGRKMGGPIREALDASSERASPTSVRKQRL